MFFSRTVGHKNKNKYIFIIQVLTIEVITSKSKMKIAVIGSGVVGLTTALELQNEYRNVKIFIIADKFYKETVSYCAAGIFRPGLFNNFELLNIINYLICY